VLRRRNRNGRGGIAQRRSAFSDAKRLQTADLDGRHGSDPARQAGPRREDRCYQGRYGPRGDAFAAPGRKSEWREFTIRELIRLAMVESDGTASDVLMRVAGEASEIQAFLDQIGIENMRVVNSEKRWAAIGRSNTITGQRRSRPLNC